MSLPSKEKYIMFLENKYFKKHIFKSIYNKILKKLKNKGIVIFDIEATINKLKLNNKSKKITHRKIKEKYDNVEIRDCRCFRSHGSHAD